MRLAEGSFINNVARLEKNEEIEKESQAIEEEIKKEESLNPTAEKKEERASLESDEESF